MVGDMRICSLLPAGTEMVYALGLGRHLVGRSGDCDYPPQAFLKPEVVVSRVSQLAPQDSLKIHKAVLKLQREGKHQFQLDISALKRLKPDLVITQNICAVCAASHPEVSAALREVSPKPKTISLGGTRLGHILSEITLLGRATKRTQAAGQLVNRLKKKIALIQAKVNRTKERPRVWCCEWLEPLMAAGHWVPELVELAGGKDPLASKGEKSRWISWEQIERTDPEVIIVMPCSYSIRQALKERWRLTQRPGWKKLSAVRNGRVFAVESGLFHRGGPRLIEGLELLAGLFHPELAVPSAKLSRRFRPFA